MGYHWGCDPKGQYVDGHEHEDVVDYRQKVFLPKMAELVKQTTLWGSKDGPSVDPEPGVHHVIIWYHDKSTFYAHDRQTQRWIHKNEKAKRYKKGEGYSLMVPATWPSFEQSGFQGL